MTDPHDMLDRSLKVLAQHAYGALLQLAGAVVDPATVTVSDTGVNLPEFRADQLFLIGPEGDPERWGWHVEFQLQPDPRLLATWELKRAAFNARLSFPVIRTVVYLVRGDRATFPSSYTIRGGGLENSVQFHSLRLWEHEAVIRSGELPELAPLLALCEAEPTEATLQRERELLLGLTVPRPVRADLLAVAVMVGTRFFARELLERIFREEMAMLKEASFIQEWIEEEATEREARGEARGRAEGAAGEARRFLLRQLRKRFGALPAEVVAQVEAGEAAWCEEVGERLLEVTSLAELGLGENGSPELVAGE